MPNAATYTRACAHLQSRMRSNRLSRIDHKVAVARNEQKAFAARREKILEYRRMVEFCESLGLEPDEAIDMSNFSSRSIVMLRQKKTREEPVSSFKTTMDAEAQKRADYLDAIGRALPDDDDGLESFDVQDQFGEVMAWVIGTAILLGIIGVAAFVVGMTRP